MEPPLLPTFPLSLFPRFPPALKSVFSRAAKTGANGAHRGGTEEPERICTALVTTLASSKAYVDPKWSRLADQLGATGTSCFLFPTSERAPAGICLFSLKRHSRCQNPGVLDPARWDPTRNGVFQCPSPTGTGARTPAAAVALLLFTGVLHRCCARVRVVTFALIHYTLFASTRQQEI